MNSSVLVMPIVSVVICTFNNADSLAITLQQLMMQNEEDLSQVEIILVNNNSTDHTADVAQQFQGAGITYRYVFEDKQGLSHARNRGAAESSGKYILFTDDDADIPANWISLYLEFIRKWEPDCAYSKIRVIWDLPKPWWYIPEFRPCFVELDYGASVLSIDDIHHEFFGKNFCIRRALLSELGGFDPALGRIGDRLVAGEETLIYRHLVRNKKAVFYFPDAGVGHRLKEKEYTEQHIFKLFIDGAYSSLQISRQLARKLVFKRPLGFMKQAVVMLISSSKNWCIFRLRGHKAHAFYHKLCVYKALKMLTLWIKLP